MSHTLLLGAEYGREVTDSTQFNGPTNQTPVSLNNPLPIPPVLSSILSRNNRFLGQTLALYAQDLLQLAPRWKALVGVRVDDFRQTLELLPPTNTTPNLGRTDFAASPRVGLVYEARSWASLYGNYSRTFDPSGENLSLATNNAALKPESHRKSTKRAPSSRCATIACSPPPASSASTARTSRPPTRTIRWHC